LLVGYGLLCPYILAGSQIVQTKTKITIDKGHKIIERSIEIEITKKSDNWMAEIEVPFKLGNEPRIFTASIFDLNGTEVRKIKKKDITSKSDIGSGSFYEDEYIKSWNMSWNTYPYRIKYSYSITLKEFLYVCNYTPYESWEIPVDKAILTVELPTDFQINISTHETQKVDSIIADELKSYTWEWSNLSPYKKENYSPPIFESAPRVTITPLKFNYDIKGSQTTWEDYGLWQHTMHQGLDDLTESEKKIISNLIKGIDGTAKKVGILHAYMQKSTRYIYVGLETGGLKPYPASYVCKNKFGDCKALTNYMQAVLAYCAIPSYQVDVYAGKKPIRIDPKIPGQQFNHVVLAVPMAGDTLWLENTSKYLPYDYTGSFIQNRRGLLIKDSTSTLVNIPSLELSDVAETRITQISKNDNESINFKAHNTYKGPLYESLLYVKNEFNEKETKDFIGKILPINNATITDLEIEVSNNEKEIIVIVESEVRNFIINAGRHKIIPAMPFELLDLEKPAQRTRTVRILTPRNINDTVSIKITTTNDQISLPEKIDISTEYGSFYESAALVNDSIMITRSYQLYAGEYNLEQYVGLYQFNKTISEKRKSFVILIKPNEQD
jgi:hypothetical protein